MGDMCAPGGTQFVSLLMKGIVLAGGKSSRFGSDKALAIYNGLPLVKRAVDLLSRFDVHPAVITRKGKSYPFLSCPVIEDKPSDLGPLGGLYTAMSVFPHNSFCVLTCDMPFLTGEALSDLIQGDRKKEEVLLFQIQGQNQPFPGIYPRCILPQVRRGLLEGRYSMKHLLENVPTKSIVWTDLTEIFCNVNNFKDLTQVFIP